MEAFLVDGIFHCNPKQGDPSSKIIYFKLILLRQVI